MDNLKTSIHSVLDNNLSTPFDYTKIYGLEYCAEEIVKLLTPKLQWKSRDITNNGGDNLLYVVYTLQDYPANVTISEWFYRPCSLVWNSRHLMSGTLDECKQFCSDKILNDFLKLCE